MCHPPPNKALADLIKKLDGPTKSYPMTVQNCPRNKERAKDLLMQIRVTLAKSTVL